MAHPDYRSAAWALHVATDFVDAVERQGGRLCQGGEQFPNLLNAEDVGTTLTMAARREPEHPAAAEMTRLGALLEQVWRRADDILDPAPLRQALEAILDAMPPAVPAFGAPR
jgi:hypothetical protein